MKKVLGLDLGVTSIGWALVNEAETSEEKSSIIDVGVRVNPLSSDERDNFNKGAAITTNAERTLKRGMRRSLQRYKLRRKVLKEILLKNGIIKKDTVLHESGTNTTHQTLGLRAKAATERIELEEFARVLLAINKKRGYKSNRKAKGGDEGTLIDGMEVAKLLHERSITPGQYVLELIQAGKKNLPEFYASDLQSEFDQIWEKQKPFHPEMLLDDFKQQLQGKSKRQTSSIFLGRFEVFTAENKATDKRLQAYTWRTDALKIELPIEEVAFVLGEINGQINASSEYLGAIGDRSKELHFNKQTVGQYLYELVQRDFHNSLANRVFYRQDYFDEFNKIWDVQAQFHTELTKELKKEIRDVVIFYQRRLKSQKGLISLCELESRSIEIKKDGVIKKKNVGPRVAPRSSPIYQEFKTWQTINHIVLSEPGQESRSLEEDERLALFEELSIRKSMKISHVRKALGLSNKVQMNFPELDGNQTAFELIEAYLQIVNFSGHGELKASSYKANHIIETISNVFEGLGINTGILKFDSSLNSKDIENQPYYRLWHLLYSYEGDNSRTGIDSLLVKLKEDFGFEPEYGRIIAQVAFKNDYASLSARAMKKILPYLQGGNIFSEACEYAGYKHSKDSLTKEEIANKVYLDKLEILPKNSLRNPVVEKILNQMVHVVNGVIDEYGKPDEVRIELARELKHSAAERELMTKGIASATRENNEIREKLQAEPFNLQYVSRNDIIRYKLYEELKDRGYKTLYSDTYISENSLFSKKFDVEHIIPQSKLFDDSFSNKTLELREVNLEKSNDTAHDYILKKYGEEGLEQYFRRVEDLHRGGAIGRAKLNKLKMSGANIPQDFIERDLRNTQFIAKKALSMFRDLDHCTVDTSVQLTARLSEDWGIMNILQELNWEKYRDLDMVKSFKNRAGHEVRRIENWNKRSDHRHHAMDALTVAFTNRRYVQYLNNLSAKSDRSGEIFGIEQKITYKNANNNRLFVSPMENFRTEAKKHLENVLASIKSKNKVVTRNTNITKRKGGVNKKVQLTPRGQLHKETVYGSIKQPVVKMEKIGGKFDAEKIATVCSPRYREALLKRLNEFDNAPKKAFTGKNSLAKNPIWIDKEKKIAVPAEVKTQVYKTVYTIRKPVNKDLNVYQIIDPHIKKIISAHIEKHNKDALNNLDENPIWQDKAKTIPIKNVTVKGISTALSLRTNNQGKAIDFVSSGNNHHVAIYRDDKGNLQENVVSLYEAVQRSIRKEAIIDKTLNADLGWEFQFTMKNNEYFVFPNSELDFDPSKIDLLDPDNYA